MDASMIRSFLAHQRFAVVGASVQRHKFGNKVLRCYAEHQLSVIPVHPTEAEIEGLACLASLGALEGTAGETAVSIVTPPHVTLGVVSEAARIGVTHVWLQPGSEDAAVLRSCEKLGLTHIYGGPCLLTELGFNAML